LGLPLDLGDETGHQGPMSSFPSVRPGQAGAAMPPTPNPSLAERSCCLDSRFTWSGSAAGRSRDCCLVQGGSSSRSRLSGIQTTAWFPAPGTPPEVRGNAEELFAGKVTEVPPSADERREISRGEVTESSKDSKQPTNKGVAVRAGRQAWRRFKGSRRASRPNLATIINSEDVHADDQGTHSTARSAGRWTRQGPPMRRVWQGRSP